jgi:hypothetical protein
MPTHPSPVFGNEEKRAELPYTLHWGGELIDGTPCAVKVARTVWSGGKFGDNFNELPIAINIRLIAASKLIIGHT